jgi:putative transcriptional regulator
MLFIQLGSNWSSNILSHFMLVLFAILYPNNVLMNRIKEVLKEKGIKQVWLAEKLGKSYNMVHGYVSNKRQPSIEVLYEIAKLLQVDAKNLLN